MSSLKLAPLCWQIGCPSPPPELHAGSAPEPAAGRSPRPGQWWRFARPATGPSLRWSCSKAAWWCSCLEVAGYRAASPLSFLGAAIQRIKRDVRSHLVHQEKAASIEGAGYPHLPSGSSPLVALQRPHSPFFRLKPIRFRSSLLKVDSLRVLPAKLSRKRRRCWTLERPVLRVCPLREVSS
jgi:hypothetical protein